MTCAASTHINWVGGLWVVNSVTLWAVVLVTRTHAVTYCHDVEVIIAIITLQERGSAVESEEE